WSGWWVRAAQRSKTMREPSGDQAGSKLPPGSFVSWLIVPADERTKICEVESSSRGPAKRWKAIAPLDPAGVARERVVIARAAGSAAVAASSPARRRLDRAFMSGPSAESFEV